MKQSGLGDHLLVDAFDLSGDIGSLSRIAGGPAPLEVTAIDKSAPERIGGLRDGGIEFQSWFNPVVLVGEHKVLSTLPYGDRQVTYCRGYGLGSPAATCVAKQINYDPARGADGSLTIGIQALANAYGLEWGFQATAGLRTDTVATSPATGVDGTAATAFGLQAYLHVIAFTGTSVTVAIQDSADNATFAAVTGATFVAATGAGVQRIATLNTATIRRYVRVVTTGTFSNAQFLVNVSRNETAGVVF
jgi:hypothetical protein